MIENKLNLLIIQKETYLSHKLFDNKELVCNLCHIMINLLQMENLHLKVQMQSYFTIKVKDILLIEIN
jgi:hypothetical protein